MKLSVYIENLKTLLKKEGDLDIGYYSDDEGNEFSENVFEPSIRLLMKDGDYISEDDLKDRQLEVEVEVDDSDDEYTEVVKRLVCIN